MGKRRTADKDDSDDEPPRARHKREQGVEAAKGDEKEKHESGGEHGGSHAEGFFKMASEEVQRRRKIIGLDRLVGARKRAALQNKAGSLPLSQAVEPGTSAVPLPLTGFAYGRVPSISSAGTFLDSRTTPSPFAGFSFATQPAPTETNALQPKNASSTEISGSASTSSLAPKGSDKSVTTAPTPATGTLAGPTGSPNPNELCELEPFQQATPENEPKHSAAEAATASRPRP